MEVQVTKKMDEFKGELGHHSKSEINVMKRKVLKINRDKILKIEK